MKKTGTRTALFPPKYKPLAPSFFDGSLPSSFKIKKFKTCREILLHSHANNNISDFMAFNVLQNSTFEFCLYFLAFDIAVLQFVPTSGASAIQHSSFQFLYSLYSNCRFDIVCFTIQHCSLKYSTSKFTQFNFQVYAVQHSTLKNVHDFDIQPQSSQ